jgi:phosphatidate cytidylyltransferase
VGLPLLLAALWAGGLPYLGVIAVLALVAYGEAARLLSVPAGAGPLAAGLVGVAGWIVTVGQGRSDLVPAFLAAYLLLLLVRQVIRYPAVSSAETASVFLGGAYAGLTFAHFAALRALPEGLLLSLFVFVLTWTFDIMAYFVGIAWGRHKLAPALSPGKSWEGAAGGTIATLLVAAVGWPAPLTSLAVRLAAGLLVVVAGQLGDLAESSLKRFCGAKDSGGLLPGHGGLLDRFDSLMFTVTAAYYLFAWTLPRVAGV